MRRITQMSKIHYMIKTLAFLALLTSFIDCDAQVRNELEYKLIAAD